MSDYNPTDWYWVVGADASKVWSSRRVAYVPVSDADYAAWSGRPTRIDAAENLLAVLLQQWAPIIHAPGCAITFAAAPDLNSTYAIDDATLTRISGICTAIAAGHGLPGGGATFLYADIAGARHAFTPDAFMSFGTAVENYIYAFEMSLETIVLGGAATMPTQPISI